MLLVFILYRLNDLYISISFLNLLLARKAAKKICEAEREHVLGVGGLCVIGTERHESRRIDNQLRGRSGRQGDPGETQFYLSLDDDLIRFFGGERMDRIAAMMAGYDMHAETNIQSKLVTKAVESAQRKVEEINFAMRKQVLDYNDMKKPLLTMIATTRSNTLPKRVKRDTAGRPTSASFDRLMVELTMSSMDTA